MKKLIGYMCLHMLVWSCSPQLKAQDTNETPEVDLSLCKKETLMTFFPAPIVKVILERHKIDKVDAIAQALSNKQQDIVKIVESKASKMDPNPFTDVSQHDAAVKLYRETHFEVFASTLKANGITLDDNQIQTILDDIQALKGQLFIECIKRESLPEEE